MTKRRSQFERTPEDDKRDAEELRQLAKLLNHPKLKYKDDEETAWLLKLANLMDATGDDTLEEHKP